MIRNRSNGERKGERSSAEVLRARRCSADPLQVLDAAFRISKGLPGTSCAQGVWGWSAQTQAGAGGAAVL